MKPSLFFIISLFFVYLLPQGSLAGTNSKDYNAIILREDFQYKIKKNGKAEYTVNKKIKILNSNGTGFGFLVLTEDKFTKLKHFSGTIFDASGKKIAELKKGDGEKICGYSGYLLYADVCHWVYYLYDEKFPCTIEYGYTQEFSSLFYWPEWSPQYSVPVDTSTYTIIAPVDIPFSTKIRGDIPDPTKTTDGKIVNIRYEKTDIAPYEKEDYVYMLGDCLPSASFIPTVYRLDKYSFSGESWESLSRDCYKMVEPSFVLNDAQKAEVDKIKSSAKTEKEIIDKIHKSICGHTRYVAIEIGVGNWIPTPACDTYERGYGDCKDLSTMYVSMLRYVGINAWPALISVQAGELTDEKVPSLQFNHMIFYAIIDGDTLWADPTCPFCEMGDIPAGDEGMLTLPIDSMGGNLLRTYTSHPEDNRIIRKAEISVGRMKKIDVAYSLTATGNAGHELKQFVTYTDQSKWGSYLKNGCFGLSKKFRGGAVQVADTSGNFCQPPTIRVSGTIKNGVKTIRGGKYVNINCFSSLFPQEKIKLAKRTLPFDLDYPKMLCDTIIVHIPKGWQIDRLPDSVSQSDEFGSMEIDYSVDDSILVIARRRVSRSYFIPIDKMDAYREHILATKKLVKDFIAFKVP